MITLNLSEAADYAAQKRENERLKAQLESPARRSYQAGVVNRLTSDWLASQTSTRSELRMYLRNIRGRSRDLARNNDYIKKFLSMCKSNIIGPAGIRLQVRAKRSTDALMAELDRDLNQVVEDAFKKWARKETCSASGKLSWLDAQRLFVSTLARDGEVLVRKLKTRKKDNPFGFTLRFIDVAWLDETHNYLLPDGNRIVMGVEVDDHDKPQAYWLTPPGDEFTYPGAMAGGGADARRRVRVPADQIIHAYLCDDENQTRGVPWAHTAMLRSKMLNGYEEAELVAARVGACKGGFLKPPEDRPFNGEEPATTIESVEPGMVQELPAGYSWESYDPTHPNTNYGNFVKGVLMGVAAGLGVTYTSLTGDLSSVNYSSIRAGLLEERDVWRALQQFVIEHFCSDVYADWLESAWLSGALEIPIEDYDRVQEPTWQARGWTWVDPLKDVQATILAINNALATRSDALAEQGEDFEEVVLQLAQEKQLLSENGIEIVTAQASGQPAPADKED